MASKTCRTRVVFWIPALSPGSCISNQPPHELWNSLRECQHDILNWGSQKPTQKLDLSIRKHLQLKPVNNGLILYATAHLHRPSLHKTRPRACLKRQILQFLAISLLSSSPSRVIDSKRSLSISFKHNEADVIEKYMLDDGFRTWGLVRLQMHLQERLWLEWVHTSLSLLCEGNAGVLRWPRYARFIRAYGDEWQDAVLWWLHLFNNRAWLFQPVGEYGTV